MHDSPRPMTNVEIDAALAAFDLSIDKIEGADLVVIDLTASEPVIDLVAFEHYMDLAA